MGEQGGDGERGGGGQGDQGGELVAPAELEGVGDEQDGRCGGEGEQAGAGGVALGAGRMAAGEAEGAGQPGQGGEGEQGSGGVSAAELVAAQERGERDGHGRDPATELPARLGDDLLGDGRCVQRVRVERVAALELPAADGAVPGGGDSLHGEELQRVAADRGRDRGRVLPEQVPVESGDRRRERARVGGLIAAQRRGGVVLEAVDAELNGPRVTRAQRALVRRQRQFLAVNRQREAPVELVRARVGKAEMTGHREGHGAVDEDREGEGGAQDGALGEAAAPAGDGHQQVGQRGQDEDLADLAGGGRGAQGKPAGDDQGGARARLPEQRRQPGDDAGLEHDVGHDGLLDLELVAIEQDGRGGQRGQPAGHPAALEHHVQHHRHRQPQHMLEPGQE